MRKRYKLLLCFFIPFIFLVLIYFITKDTKIYYLSMGDFLAKGQLSDKENTKSYSYYVQKHLKKSKKLEYYSNFYSNANYRSIDLLNIIKENKKLNNKTIKHELIKADVVTVSIGVNDLFYKLNIGIDFSSNNQSIYTYIDQVMVDINRFLHELRLSCKENIIILGYYNPFINYSKELADNVEPYVLYANSKLIYLINKYNMKYVDLHKLFLYNKNCLPNYYSIYPNKKGQIMIANKIINIIEGKNLQKR